MGSVVSITRPDCVVVHTRPFQVLRLDDCQLRTAHAPGASGCTRSRWLSRTHAILFSLNKLAPGHPADALHLCASALFATRVCVHSPHTKRTALLRVTDEVRSVFGGAPCGCCGPPAQISQPPARARAPRQRPRDHFGRLQPRADARASQLRHAHAHDGRRSECNQAQPARAREPDHVHHRRPAYLHAEHAARLSCAGACDAHAQIALLARARPC